MIFYQVSPRNSLDQTDLWTHLLGIVVIINRYRRVQPTLGSISPRQEILGWIRKWAKHETEVSWPENSIPLWFLPLSSYSDFMSMMSWDLVEPNKSFPPTSCLLSLFYHSIKHQTRTHFEQNYSSSAHQYVLKNLLSFLLSISSHIATWVTFKQQGLVPELNKCVNLGRSSDLCLSCKNLWNAKASSWTQRV